MMWEKMDPVFADIIEENEEIKERRDVATKNRFSFVIFNRQNDK